MENAVSTQSQKITLVPNFVRHKSDQLSSMALVIIAPCNSFTANSRNYKKIGQFYQPPSHGSCIFFQCRCKLIFFWKFVTFVSGMQHVIMKMTMSRFTMPQYEYYKTYNISLVGPYFGGVTSRDFDRKMRKSKVLPKYKSVRSAWLYKWYKS